MPSPSSASARQARLAFADQLRDVRVAAGLTGRDLAARAGWHGGSKVSKIEHGTRPPSSDDVRAWCQVCGVPRERAEELLAEQRAVAGMWVSPPAAGGPALAAPAASPAAWWESGWSRARRISWQHIPSGRRPAARTEVLNLLEELRAPDGSITRTPRYGWTTAARPPEPRRSIR